MPTKTVLKPYIMIKDPRAVCAKCTTRTGERVNTADIDIEDLGAILRRQVSWALFGTLNRKALTNANRLCG